jgi:hypothetical protein
MTTFRNPEYLEDPKRCNFQLDTSKARVYIRLAGTVKIHLFEIEALALNFYYALSRGTAACFRGTGDGRPILHQDFLDIP